MTTATETAADRAASWAALTPKERRAQVHQDALDGLDRLREQIVEYRDADLAAFGD